MQVRFAPWWLNAVTEEDPPIAHGDKLIMLQVTVYFKWIKLHPDSILLNVLH